MNKNPVRRGVADVHIHSIRTWLTHTHVTNQRRRRRITVSSGKLDKKIYMTLDTNVVNSS